MKIKPIITTALLLFVGISVIYLVTDESRSGPIADEGARAIAGENTAVEEVVAEEHATQADKFESPEDATPRNPRHKVIAYYFYGTVRCSTCRIIEAYAEDAIKNGFQNELQSGVLEWRAVNVNIPENEHFIRDYELTTRSVVLADIWDGQQKQWKNLMRVWWLVRNKQAFTSYIQEETRKYLAGSYE